MRKLVAILIFVLMVGAILPVVFADRSARCLGCEQGFYEITHRQGKYYWDPDYFSDLSPYSLLDDVTPVQTETTKQKYTIGLRREIPAQTSRLTFRSAKGPLSESIYSDSPLIRSGTRCLGCEQGFYEIRNRQGKYYYDPGYLTKQKPYLMN